MNIRNLLPFIICVIMLSPLHNYAQKHEKMKFDNKEMIGNLKLKQLENVDGFENLSITEEFRGDKKQLEQLKMLLNEDIEIDAFIGTWCSDTQFHFPQFIALLRQAGYDVNKMRIIGLDKDKKSPEGLEIKEKVEFVPTFIFKKNKDEIGRIVEAPKKSMIADTIKILSKK